MKVQGVIFDLGGTLSARLRISYEEANATALMHWLRDRAIAVDDGFVRALVRERQLRFVELAGSTREFPAAEALRPVLQQHGAPGDPAFLVDAEAVFFAPELDAMRPLPGAVDLLRHLRRLGLVVGLASNASSHYFVVETCRRLQFAPYLDPIVSSAAVGWAKPDPRIYQAVLARWSLPAAAAVMVGDTLEADIVGARQVGLRSVLLTAEHTTPDIHRRSRDEVVDVQPDAVAGDLPEVSRLIEAWR